ncbi:MAG: hypothetical protein ACJ0A4_04620 [Paracoccaceae bacterium]
MIFAYSWASALVLRLPQDYFWDTKILLIVTNNLNIANILKKNIQTEVVVTGGNLRKSDGALIGQPVLETVQNFKFDLAIIGMFSIRQRRQYVRFRHSGNTR